MPFGRFLSACLILGFALAAAENAPGKADLPQRAVTLIRDLNAESFQVREDAEKALTQLGPDVFPLVKAALAAAADADWRQRLQRVVRTLALAAETDPEVLGLYGREDAGARRFAEAAQFYARAAAVYRQRAEAAGDEARRKDDLAAAQKMDERRRRAEQWAAILAGGAQILNQQGRTYALVPREFNGQSTVEYRELPGGDRADW